MRRAAGLSAAALLALASAADAQAWNVETIAPGGSASSYSFTGATDSEALRLDTSCRAIVYGFDPNVASGAASGTADLLSCPSLTATGAACQKIADLDADIAGATANPAYRFLRCDVQTSPAGATSVCTVACAAQSAATGSGGGGGGGGVTDAGALTFTPDTAADWLMCDPDPVMTGDYLDCIGAELQGLGEYVPGDPTDWSACDTLPVVTADFLDCIGDEFAKKDELVDVTVSNAVPLTACNTPLGTPCIHLVVVAGVPEGLYCAEDGGAFAPCTPGFSMAEGTASPNGAINCEERVCGWMETDAKIFWVSWTTGNGSWEPIYLTPQYARFRYALASYASSATVRCLGPAPGIAQAACSTTLNWPLLGHRVPRDNARLKQILCNFTVWNTPEASDSVLLQVQLRDGVAAPVTIASGLTVVSTSLINTNLVANMDEPLTLAGADVELKVTPTDVGTANSITNLGGACFVTVEYGT